MITFFDSSAYAKRFIDEDGSEVVDDLCMRVEELAVSVLCVPEVLSALNRRVRERCITRRGYEEAKQCLMDDLKDATVVNLMPATIATAVSVLETSPLRTMDALQIACAIECRADLFVSADRQQIAAARKAGLQTQFV